MHFFYGSLCPSCAALNYQKRLQTSNMLGRVAIVTGGSVCSCMHAAAHWHIGE